MYIMFHRPNLRVETIALCGFRGSNFPGLLMPLTNFGWMIYPGRQNKTVNQGHCNSTKQGQIMLELQELLYLPILFRPEFQAAICSVNVVREELLSEIQA
jgi:hypothetical protein